MPRHDKDSSWQRACDFSELKNHKHWKLCRLYIAFAVVKLFGNLGDRNNYQSWFTCWTSFWDLKILEKRFYYNSDRKFWILSTIGDFAKLQSWMTVQHVLGALLKLSWKAFYNENYPPKKQRLHLINIIEDSFGFLCWLGLVSQRISSFIASAIKKAPAC